jgi:uncharacterized protein (TIGR02246 family)
MTKHMFAVAVFLSAASLAGCDHHRGKGHNADTEEIVAAIRGQEAQWNRHYAARDAAGLASMYAADAALANPGAPLLSGAAIRPALDQYAADTNLQVQFSADRIQVARSGDLAYSRGSFTMRSTDPATRQPRNDQGSYLTVWQRQPDGSWRAVEDFVTPGPPVAAGAGPTADSPASAPAE